MKRAVGPPGRKAGGRGRGRAEAVRYQDQFHNWTCFAAASDLLQVAHLDHVLVPLPLSPNPLPPPLLRSLPQGVKAVLVVNKIDRPSARPEFVVDKTFDLFCELGASDEQTDFDIVYTSALRGVSGHSPDSLEEGMAPLFDTILKLPAPKVDQDSPVQLLVANIDYDDFKGKLGIGRLSAGTLRANANIGFMQPGEDMKSGKVRRPHGACASGLCRAVPHLLHASPSLCRSQSCSCSTTSGASPWTLPRPGTL